MLHLIDGELLHKAAACKDDLPLFGHPVETPIAFQPAVLLGLLPGCEDLLYIHPYLPFLTQTGWVCAGLFFPFL